MLTSGDVVVADLGEPLGREAGFPRPVVVVTAQLILAQTPNVVHVVPVTTTRRGFRSEVELEPDSRNGLSAPSAVQCQHVRAVALTRLSDAMGNVGAGVLAQLRETITDLLDL